MRRLALVVGVLVLVAGMPTANAARKGLLSARAGRLAGTTTITWTGTAGISLDIPRPALLKDRDADLIVDGGTYAFVRIVGAPVASCHPAIGPYCHATSLSFMRAMHDPPVSGVRARSHWTVAPDPATLAAPRVGIYLFTDGRATLTLRTDLPGRTGYRAGGRFRGRVTRLPRTCAPVACADNPTTSNSVTYGGASFDLGVRGGWAEMVGVAANTDRDARDNQLYGINGCLFPNPLDPALSGDSADHPYGCGVTPANSSQTYPTVVQEVNGAPSYGSARASMLYWTAARGQQYVGYRAKSFGALAARVDAYGIWFNVGIR